jgi:alpha-tubulin suppressor-like RCC1 family protein
MTSKMSRICCALGYHPGLKADIKTPKQLAKNLGDIIDVATGVYHNAIINSNGTLFTFGKPRSNHLTHPFSRIPIEVEMPKVFRVEVGDYFTTALDKDGVVYTWGCDGKGSIWTRIVGYRHVLGRKSTNNNLIPTPIDLPEKVIEIKSGREHCLALTDNFLYSWGVNDFGQLGSTEIFDFNETPKIIKFFSDQNERVVKIEAGGNSSAAITSSGKLYVWGSNEEKSIGQGEKNTIIMSPSLIPLSLSQPVKDVALGSNTMMVLTESDEIFVCGMDLWYELKEFSIPWSSKPMQIFCGQDYFAVLGNDGKIAHYGGCFNPNTPDLEIPDAVEIMPKELFPGILQKVVGKHEYILGISVVEEE